jgi:(S)-sulfolactate dehydrogenase
VSARRPLAVVPEFLPDEALALLADGCRVVYDPDLYADRPALLAEMASAAAVLIRNRTIIDDELLAAAQGLRVIGRLGVGIDNIDTDGCAAAGVEVIRASGGNAVAVAEYVMGALLTLARPVFDKTDSMIRGEWPRQGHAFGRELRGMTIGLVGLGAIAREVAARAVGFEMRIVACDPFLGDDDPAWRWIERRELGALLAEADVVSLHVPLTDETTGLVDATAVASMKPGAILINTARGGIVDEAAVVLALRTGRLGGAALDVFAEEPLGSEAGGAYAGLDDLVLTPHLAGNTREAVDSIARSIVVAVLAALDAPTST